MARFLVFCPVDTTHCPPPTLPLVPLKKVTADLEAQLKPNDTDTPADAPLEALIKDVDALKEDVIALQARAEARDKEDEECRKDRLQLNQRARELSRRITNHRLRPYHTRFENLTRPYQGMVESYIDYKERPVKAKKGHVPNVKLDFPLL